MQNKTKCTLCDDPAAAIFEMSRGCFCSDKTIQPLCMQHIVRATPLGSMELLEILEEGWREEILKRKRFKDGHE